MIPRKRPKVRMAVAERGPFRSRQHLRFVRSRVCAICSAESGIEAAHVRWRTDGGEGLKPSDYWTLPLCREHHRIGTEAQHNAKSELAFYAKHGIDPYALCKLMAAASTDLEVQALSKTMRARI